MDSLSNWVVAMVVVFAAINFFKGDAINDIVCTQEGHAYKATIVGMLWVSPKNDHLCQGAK